MLRGFQAICISTATLFGAASYGSDASAFPIRKRLEGKAIHCLEETVYRFNTDGGVDVHSLKDKRFANPFDQIPPKDVSWEDRSVEFSDEMRTVLIYLEIKDRKITDRLMINRRGIVNNCRMI